MATRGSLAKEVRVRMSAPNGVGGESDRPKCHSVAHMMYDVRLSKRNVEEQRGTNRMKGCG